MTPFIYLDKLVQSFGLHLSYGNLYKQPKWVKWTNDELVVSLPRIAKRNADHAHPADQDRG